MADSRPSPACEHVRVGREDLRLLSPRHATLVGVDSDGCVFDTMGIKQRECFHPEIILAWGLAAIEPAVRETAEYVNLYSRDRGSNRFVALLKVFELLPSHPEAISEDVILPPTEALRSFVHGDRPLTETTLREMVAQCGNQELARVLTWSLTVNRVVEQKVHGIEPFDGARECLARMADESDLIVCSQTPEEALVREWAEHKLDDLVRLIAGQELGTKTEHLTLVGGGKYLPYHGLMIGDAVGDQKAARQADMLFYPILPGQESRSWHRLREEAYPRFLSGDYAGDYEADRIADFEACLPEVPPWSSP